MFLSLSGRIVLLGSVFALAVSWLYFLVKVAAPDNRTQLELGFPSNLEELKRISLLLNVYSKNHPVYVLVLFGSAYIFKQTFAIPGSVFMNLLGGAIYGMWIGFPLCCLLTATGATCCYFLSKMAGQQLVERYFARQLALLSSRIHSDPGHLLQILISLRLFPMSPNWFLNMASPLVRIPIGKFFISVFVGLMPYNFICVQTGSILGELNSLDDVFNLKTFGALLAIAVTFMTPTLIRRFRGGDSHKPEVNNKLDKPRTQIKATK